MLDATSKKNPRRLEWAGMIGLKTGLALHQEQGSFGGRIGLFYGGFGAAGSGALGLIGAASRFGLVAGFGFASLQGRDKGESSEA
jgi:hypothetical protein